MLQDWTKAGLQSTYTDYPATVALFTSGKAAMMINGVWEVPTMTDLAKQGKLFDWGAVEIPVIFDKPCTYADSHSFAIPKNKGKEISPEKRAAVLEVISWIDKNSLFWATAGHIPAYNAGHRDGRIQGDGAQRHLLAPDRQHDLRSEVDEGRRRRADLRRHVHLLRADAQRRDGTRPTAVEIDQGRAEQHVDLTGWGARPGGPSRI